MLPSGVVDIVEASATLEDGILNIKLKKRNPTKRLIEIK
jgi:HSP20 family molecular chaperone IbpA